MKQGTQEHLGAIRKVLPTNNACNKGNTKVQKNHYDLTNPGKQPHITDKNREFFAGRVEEFALYDDETINKKLDKNPVIADFLQHCRNRLRKTLITNQVVNSKMAQNARDAISELKQLNRDFDELPTPLRSIVKTYQLEYDLLDELKIYQKFAIARMNILRKNIQRFETALERAFARRPTRQLEFILKNDLDLPRSFFEPDPIHQVPRMPTLLEEGSSYSEDEETVQPDGNTLQNSASVSKGGHEEEAWVVQNFQNIKILLEEILGRKTIDVVEDLKEIERGCDLNLDTSNPKRILKNLELVSAKINDNKDEIKNLIQEILNQEVMDLHVGLSHIENNLGKQLPMLGSRHLKQALKNIIQQRNYLNSTFSTPNNKDNKGDDSVYFTAKDPATEFYTPHRLPSFSTIRKPYSEENTPKGILTNSRRNINLDPYWLMSSQNKGNTEDQELEWAKEGAETANPLSNTRIAAFKQPTPPAIRKEANPISKDS